MHNCMMLWKHWYIYAEMGADPLVRTTRSWTDAKGIALTQHAKG